LRERKSWSTACGLSSTTALKFCARTLPPLPRSRPWQVGYRWRTILGKDSADAINHFGQNLLLSGIRPDGKDGTNALTWLMLNSMERLHTPARW
jgi:hypothetical protein